VGWKEKKNLVARNVKFRKLIDLSCEEKKIEIKVRNLKLLNEEKKETEEEFEENTEEENLNSDTYRWYWIRCSMKWRNTDMDEIQLEPEDPIVEIPRRKSSKIRKISDRYTDYVILTYKEAVKDVERNWAIEEEKRSLINNNTWASWIE